MLQELSLKIFKYILLCLSLFLPFSVKGQGDSTNISKTVSEMKDLEVKASKILIVQHGDTLVYNADMLRLAAGTMLDDLINALPYAGIDRDGLITVKGEPIKELLIEGRDFFQGDPSVALKNLPAFTVKKVKVYRRVPKDAYLVRSDKGMKARETDPLVMDVRLKAKYQNGVIANLESASGLPTEKADRYLYLDRIFGLHYNKRRSISAYVGMNNVNDNGQPQAKGIWRDSNVPEGEDSHLLGGLDYTYTNPITRMEIANKLKISRRHQILRSGSSSMRYLSNGQLHDISRSESDGYTLSAGWDGSFFYPGRNFTMTLSPHLLISKGKSNSQSQSLSFTKHQSFGDQIHFIDSISSLDMENLWQVPSMVNRQAMDVDNAGTGFNVGGVARMSLRLPFLPNIVRMFLDGIYLSNTQSSQTANSMDFVSTGEVRRMFLKNDLPNELSNINLGIENDVYTHQEEERSAALTIGYQGSWNHSEKENSLYKKDSVFMWNPEMPEIILALEDAQPFILDPDNSYEMAETDWQHSLSLSFSYVCNKGLSLYTNIPVSIKSRNIADTRRGVTLEQFRTDWTFDPRVSLSYKGFSLGYRITTGLPAMSSLLDRKDNSNPMYVRLGNPTLHSSKTHIPSVGYTKRWNKQHAYLNVSADYQTVRGAISLMRYYDAHTGVLTVQNRNVDGNWSSNLRGRFQTGLDKGKHWILSADIKMTYGLENIFDRRDSDVAKASHSAKKLIVNATTELDYRCKDWIVTINGEYNWRHASSTQMYFHNINYSDCLFGIAAKTPVYHGLSAGTAFTVHTYRGSDDSSMNRTHYVWNIDASYDFSEKWSLKLEAQDIFHQLTAISTGSSALGWSEGWRNTRPSYCMLHVLYRFNILPK